MFFFQFFDAMMQVDLIEVFKILIGFDNINTEDYFTVDQSYIKRR